MVSEGYIEKLYSLYVKNKYFYRTFSKEHLRKTKKEGLNPKDNPYQKQKKSLMIFFGILDRLEKKGYSYVYMHWPRSKPIGSIISKVFKKSLKKNYIDLTPNDFDDLRHYQGRKGGDLPLTVFHISQDLLKWNYPLTFSEKKLILKLRKWAKSKINYNNVTIKISAKSKYLEKADLQRFLGKPYLPSPFGSFVNFKRCIKKYGYKTYKPYLQGTEQYYLRLKQKMPSNEIIFI